MGYKQVMESMIAARISSNACQQIVTCRRPSPLEGGGGGEGGGGEGGGGDGGGGIEGVWAHVGCRPTNVKIRKTHDVNAVILLCTSCNLCRSDAPTPKVTKISDISLRQKSLTLFALLHVHKNQKSTLTHRTAEWDIQSIYRFRVRNMKQCL